MSLGKSEVVWNDLNPDFTKVFRVNYFFEKNQILRAEIYEHDDEAPELIGSYQVAVNKLLTCPKQMIRDNLHLNLEERQDQGKARGKIIIRADSVQDSNHEMCVSVECQVNTKRRKKFTFGCFHGWPDNPILTVERKLDDMDDGSDDWIKIYQSNVETDSIQPHFKKLYIKM